MAADTGGSSGTATQSFVATVSNEAPVAVGTLVGPHAERVGRSVTVEVSGAFTDPDGPETRRRLVLSPGGGQSFAISASKMTAASLPPNVEENTVMPAKLYSSGVSFISRCIVPVRFVASKM